MAYKESVFAKSKGIDLRQAWLGDDKSGNNIRRLELCFAEFRQAEQKHSIAASAETRLPSSPDFKNISVTCKLFYLNNSETVCIGMNIFPLSDKRINPYFL